MVFIILPENYADSTVYFKQVVLVVPVTFDAVLFFDVINQKP